MKEVKLEESAYQFDAKMSLKQAIPLGLQHVCAMFVGNLTPLLIITSACGIAGGEFADLQVTLLQSAMFVAGVVTLVQLFTVGPVGGGVPIIMGTSSGFIGVFNSVVGSMGGGVLAYGAIMGASIIGGIFESVLGFFLKPLRKFFPPVVTGTVVLSIGLSLISVGINSFGGGNAAKDFGSAENLLLAVFVLVVILFFKHWTTGFLSSSSILIGIVAGYLAAFIMGFVLPTTSVTAGVIAAIIITAVITTVIIIATAAIISAAIIITAIITTVIIIIVIIIIAAVIRTAGGIIAGPYKSVICICGISVLCRSLGCIIQLTFSADDLKYLITAGHYLRRRSIILIIIQELVKFNYIVLKISRNNNTSLDIGEFKLLRESRTVCKFISDQSRNKSQNILL